MNKSTIKIGHHDLYIHGSTLYLQEHVVYEHYAFDYDLVGTFNFADHHMTTL